MAGFRRLSRKWAWVWISVIAGMVAPAVQAQGLSYSVAGESQVLVLDIRRALNESNAGQLILEKYKAAIIALNNEFNILQTQLIAEEQELRDLRSSMEVSEFVKLAEAFDQKSTQAREEYRLRKQAIDDELNENTDRLARILSQYAGEVMEEKGAAVVLMKNQVIVSSNAIDITSGVMERANQLINTDTFLIKE
ncbi:MAG: OmpH family outer membrane protein [Paracoccaceae bacterium]|jgi:Skp family chaperone for outer membrane proteins